MLGAIKRLTLKKRKERHTCRVSGGVTSGEITLLQRETAGEALTAVNLTFSLPAL